MQQKTMDFPTAIRQVIEGRRITKLEWKDPNIRVFLANGTLMIRKSDGLHQLILSDGDLYGLDWVTADSND